MRAAIVGMGLTLRRAVGRAGVFLALMGVVSSACADGLQGLEWFLKHVQSGQGTFTQVVSTPQKSGESGVRQKQSSGKFAMLKPGKFRFEYVKPFPQVFVADGKKIWNWDPDLEQLSEHASDEVLGSTPMQMALAKSLAELRERFEVTAVSPSSDDKEWVKAHPRQPGSSILELRWAMTWGDAKTMYLDVSAATGQHLSLVFHFAQVNGLSSSSPLFAKPGR